MTEHKKAFEDEMHYLLDAACDYGSTGLSTDFDLGEAIDRAYIAATTLGAHTNASLQSENTTLRSQVESLLAVVAAKDEALNKSRETMLSLVNSRSSEAEGTEADWVADIDAGLVLKPSDVELVEVGKVERDGNGHDIVMWTDFIARIGTKLYLLKQKEGV